MKMDLGSAFLKLQRFSLDPKFSRIFPPHNHVYSDCSIWHLLSWLINYTSPKNDPVGWDFDPIRNFRSFEKEACFIPVQWSWTSQHRNNIVHPAPFQNTSGHRNKKKMVPSAGGAPARQLPAGNKNPHKTDSSIPATHSLEKYMTPLCFHSCSLH